MSATAAAAASSNLQGDACSSDLVRRLELHSVDSRLCQRPRILSVLSSLLERVVSRNERHATQVNGMLPSLTVFHGLRAPSISIDKYIERIFKYANCSPSCFVVAYVYIDRLLQHKSSVPITSLNVHRLLITSVMVAAKFLDDAYYNNAYYAKVGGVSTQEMNRLELEFLFHLNFRLQVTVSVFDSYCSRLEMEVASSSAVERPLLLHQQHAHQQHQAAAAGVGCCGLDGAATQGKKTSDERRLAVRCSIAGGS